MTTIRARITTRPEPKTETKDIPVITKELLELGPYEAADRLWEMGIQENCEVGVVLEDVPAGTEVRKPSGEQPYMRADDDWVRRATGFDDPRILMVADGYRMSLWKPDKVVVAQLEELFDQWDAVDACLGDYRCPK